MSIPAPALPLAIAALVLSADLATAQPAGGPWPLFHGDAQRTGQSAVAGPTSAASAVQLYRGLGPFRSSPVIGPDGTIYVGSRKQLCALDPTNPADPEKWCTTINGTVTFASPAVGVDPLDPAKVVVYIGGRDNHLHVIDETGVLLYSVPVGIDGDIATSPAIAPGGTIFFGGSLRLHGLAANGSLLWVTPLDAFIFTASPALALDGTVYAGTVGGSLYAIDPDTGAERWKLNVGRRIKFTSPAVGPDGTIYIGTREALVAVEDLGDSASIKWEFPVESHGIQSTPAIAPDGTIYVGATGRVGTFYAISPSGNLLWEHVRGRRYRGSPVLDAAGRVYVTASREILALDTATGALLWSFATGRNINSSPALGADGTLYVGGADRILWAIGP